MAEKILNGQKIRDTKMVRINPKLTEKQKKKILDKMALEYEMEVKSGTGNKGNIKFMDFTLNKWLLDYAEKAVADTTLSRYMDFLESRIFPAIRTY